MPPSAEASTLQLSGKHSTRNEPIKGTRELWAVQVNGWRGAYWEAWFLRLEDSG